MGLQRDPEIVREVLRRYQGACDTVIRQYGGHIAAYVGDGVLVYFGHPVAHEDDPHRAVRAGLDILQALEPVIAEARERYDLDLSIRAAVHTGLVVRAEMGSPSSPDRDAIVGDTPNLAARLQDHAQAGTLLVSQATYQLVRGWFLVAPRGRAGPQGLRRAGAGVPGPRRSASDLPDRGAGQPEPVHRAHGAGRRSRRGVGLGRGGRERHPGDPRRGRASARAAWPTSCAGGSKPPTPPPSSPTARAIAAAPRSTRCVA